MSTNDNLSMNTHMILFRVWFKRSIYIWLTCSQPGAQLNLYYYPNVNVIFIVIFTIMFIMDIIIIFNFIFIIVTVASSIVLKLYYYRNVSFVIWNISKIIINIIKTDSFILLWMSFIQFKKNKHKLMPNWPESISYWSTLKFCKIFTCKMIHCSMKHILFIKTYSTKYSKISLYIYINTKRRYWIV